MGKKVKTGKSRLDKYYHLAKEQGYRARSAFKLIQLTQRNDIFSGCRALLDLCAAPGGWLQVAQKNMPIASKIVGVDLAPIKPIHGVVTIQADITTQRCRTLLKKEFQDIDVDVVLHDGAPNVGTSWAHDAYAQNELVLHATKLACEFLRAGGTYITKVFRSQDYVSLLWVFQQLFNRVTATKPSSSRNVSAEIFVLCSGYKKPPKVDPKFFDARHVFINAELPGAKAGLPAPSANGPKRNLGELLKAMGQKHRQGYNDGDDYRETPVTAFLETTDPPAEFLVYHHKLTFPEDDVEAQRIRSHPTTTEEILQCCTDLRVLGKREYFLLIKWRAKLLKELAAEARKRAMEVDEDEDADPDASSAAVDPEDLELEKEAIWQKELEALKGDMDKKALKEKRKLREKLKKLRLQRQMSLGAFDAADEDPELFSLKGTALLEEEDKVLTEAGAWDKVEKLDAVPDFAGSADSDDTDDDDEESEGTKDEEDETDWINDDAKRLSKMAVDLDIWASQTKERQREKEAKRMLKRQKETRRQQAYAEWNRELAAESDKLNEAARKVRFADSDSDQDDNVSEASEFRINDDHDEDDHSTQNDPSGSEPSEEASVDDDRMEDVDAEGEDQNGNHDLANLRTSRWFQQSLFKDAGITLDDLEREDRKVLGSTTTNGKTVRSSPDNNDVIHELSDSELAPMPLTDKQKRKEKRRRELEKKNKVEASKRARVSRSGLGELVEDDGGVLPGAHDKGSSKSSSSFTVVPAPVPSAPQNGYSESEEDSDHETETRNGAEGVPAYRPKTAEEVTQVQALGSLLASKRTRFDLIDGAYNRYAFDDDEGVPEWFLEDEADRMRPELPVTKEMMKEYRQKLKEISHRPIRKVLEATGRKKLRLKKRLAKVRRQAETIASSAEYSEPSKAASIQRLMNKARREEKHDKSYIASRKTGGGAVVGRRRRGVSADSGGAYRVVDKRLKKDKRGMKNAQRKNSKRRH